MPTNLKSKLLPNDNMTTELEIFLNSHYGSASQSEPNKVIYGNELVVEYYNGKNKKHLSTEIKSIYLISENESVFFNNIEIKIKEALSTDNGIEVRRTVLFSPYKVTGNYRLKNDFQILEVSPSAPKLDSLMGDHPFIFEYAYRKSTSFTIDAHRASIKLEELSLLLNMFIQEGVKHSSNNVRFEWVLVKNPLNNNAPETRYLQTGYMPTNEDFDQDEHGFTSNDLERTIKLIDTNKHFKEYGMYIGDEFNIPVDINNFFEKFYSLCEDDRDDFLRAAYWKRVGADVFYISQSNSFIALINSIESLIHQEKSESKCSSCGKENKKGLTQLFHDFIENNFSKSGINSTYIKKLYDIRSKYTHGKKLMPRDIGATGFNPASNSSFTDYRNLERVVQISLINWLMSR